MKVRAKRLGYYNHRRRREGDIFELTDETMFSDKWMERLDDNKPTPKKSKEPENRSQDPSEEVI